MQGVVHGPGGVHDHRGRGTGVHGPRGAYGPRLGWGVASQHALRQTPHVNRLTNRCKNITLPQTSFAGGNELHFKFIYTSYKLDVHVRTYELELRSSLHFAFHPDPPTNMHN